MKRYVRQPGHCYRHGSIGIGMPGSLADRIAQIQDILACTERWISRAKESNLPDDLNTAWDILNQITLKEDDRKY